MSRFQDNVVLITGAGSGIGRQLALLMSGEGARIAAIDLRREPLEKLASELPNCAIEVADVTDRTSLGTAVASLTRKLGPIDVLVASAGIGRMNSGLDFSAKDFEAQIQVNLVGVANSIEAVLPDMLRRKSGQIAVLSSLASYRGLPGLLGYCASKSGVVSLCEGLRVEVARFGVHVTCICPGWIKTPMTENGLLKNKNMMQLDVAAARILRAIRERSRHVAFPSGTLWQVRLLKYMPSAIGDWLTGRALARVRRSR